MCFGALLGPVAGRLCVETGWWLGMGMGEGPTLFFACRAVSFSYHIVGCGAAMMPECSSDCCPGSRRLNTFHLRPIPVWVGARHPGSVQPSLVFVLASGH